MVQSIRLASWLAVICDIKRYPICQKEWLACSSHHIGSASELLLLSYQIRAAVREPNHALGTFSIQAIYKSSVQLKTTNQLFSLPELNTSEKALTMRVTL